MNASEYQQRAARTINPELPLTEQCNNAILGLAGELGEIVDLIKKTVHHSHTLDTDKLLDEIGDCEWYVAWMCGIAGWNLADMHRDETPMRIVPAMDILGAVHTVGSIALRLHTVGCNPLKLHHMQAMGLFRDVMDVHTFLTALAFHYHAKMPEIWQHNISKLERRYPTGFSAEASINRAA